MKTTTLRAPLALALAVALSACGSSADEADPASPGYSNGSTIVGRNYTAPLHRIDDTERGVSCYVFAEQLSCVRTSEVRP